MSLRIRKKYPGGSTGAPQTERTGVPPTYRKALTTTVVVALLGTMSLTGCASGTGTTSATPNTTSAAASASASTPASDSAEPTAKATLTVLAAASLTDTFTELGKQFEAAHPGVTVALSFDGSPTLVTQIEQGAPADVFASADTANMQKLSDDGFVAGTPTLFATNNLVIAVPKDNPAGITGLNDLTKPGVTTVTCAAGVPCGDVATKVFAAAGVTVTPVSLEQNVKSVATKVSSDEADAGMIYSTDVAATNGALTAIALPDDPAITAAAQTQYPIAVVKDAPQADLASQFIAFVLSAPGQSVLSAAGFGAPPAS
jgi:molybdate transport system substrate-binding protein